MSARGNYRAIHVVLIDGPDFQALPPNAKLTFLVAKLNLGPYGLGVLYPGTLEAQTGLSGDQVMLALETLDHGGWLRRERNLMWVVEGWKYEPCRRPGNSKQTVGLERYLSSLPRLGIVDDFRNYYGLSPSSPMPKAVGSDAKGGRASMPNGISIEAKPSDVKPLDLASKPNRNSTDANPDQLPSDRRQRTENREQSSAPVGASVPVWDDELSRQLSLGGVPDSPPVAPTDLTPADLAPADVAPPRSDNWVDDAVTYWTGKVGAIAHGRIGKVLKPFVDQYGWPATRDGLDDWLCVRKNTGKPIRLEWFAAEATPWIEDSGMELVDAQRDLTRRGKRIAGVAT